MTTVLSIVTDIDFFNKITSLFSGFFFFFFFLRGGGGVWREEKREREREREREIFWKKIFFKYSLGKKGIARILFNPNQKI